MDSTDPRSRRDQQPYHDIPRLNGDRPHPSAPPTARALSADRMDGDLPGYTLMVAGRRTGKTAFLRLLLDTSLVSPAASQEQLASVAKFVQQCGGYTSHIKTVSVNVDLAMGLGSEKTELQTLTLSLIDTPSLDFDDAVACQRTVDEIMRHVDTRFTESVEDVSALVIIDWRLLLTAFVGPQSLRGRPPCTPVSAARPPARRARVASE